MLKVTINGNVMALPSELETIADVIAHFEFKSPIIIVEHNEQVLKQKDHAETKVTNGDVLEFVQFVGGG